MNTEDRAFCQLFFSGIAGFLIPFLLTLILTTYFFIWGAIGQKGWWIIEDIMTTLVEAFMAGMCGALVITKLVDAYHYRKGVHRCNFCGRVFRKAFVPCECCVGKEGVERYYANEKRKRRHILKRYRRSIRPVLLVYAAMVPVVVVIAAISPGRGAYPLVVETLIWHALICGLLAIVAELASDVLKYFKLAYRFRVRSAIIRPLLLAWPLAFAVVMLICSMTG